MLQPTNKTFWDSPISSRIKSRHYQNALDNFKFAEFLNDADLFNFHPDKQLLVFKNNHDWFESFSRNAHLRAKLAILGFPDPSHFRLIYTFRNLYYTLFQLSPELKLEYDELLKLRNNTTNLICAQIRIGGVRENVKYDFQFNERNVSMLFWDFIRKNLIQGISFTNYLNKLLKNNC